jgi:isoleucyl-tRNA synthetase
LEPLRAAKQIGSALDAELSIYADAKAYAELSKVAPELRFYLIVSDVKLLLLDSTVSAPRVATSCGEIVVTASVSAHSKCARCWHHRSDVGSHSAHPELCGRCIENVDGAGETRVYF